MSFWRKRRFEPKHCCRKGFLKFTHLEFLYEFVDIFLKIQEEFSFICSDRICWRIIVQSEQKGYKKNIADSIRMLTYEVWLFWWKKKGNNIILANGQEYMLCVSTRLDTTSIHSMLLLYYKTKLAFFNGYFVQERSIIILWEFSKTEYYIGSSGIFGQVYKGFKLKREATN